MKHHEIEQDDALRTRLLRAIAANGVARLNFPGVFMGLAGRATGPAALEVTCDAGGWLRGSDGEAHLPVLGVLADVALGAVTRMKTGPTHRPATVQLHMELTGAATAGPLTAEARFVDYSERSALRHAFTAGSVRCGDVTVAQLSGAFALLALPEGATQTTLPWLTGPLQDVAPARVDALEAHERGIVQAYDAARQAAGVKHSFVEHFWCGVPVKHQHRAELTMAVGAHVGNRVGQVHGGILFGVAAQVACAAAPHSMRLSTVSAWFTSPGQGERLDVRAEVLHQSRNIAVVRTAITGDGGVRVLEAVTQHLRRDDARAATA